MIAAVISACFISDPQTCQDFRLPLAENADARVCAMQVMPLLPDWAAEHSTLRIEKWRCDTGEFADL